MFENAHTGTPYAITCPESPTIYLPAIEAEGTRWHNAFGATQRDATDKLELGDNYHGQLEVVRAQDHSTGQTGTTGRAVVRVSVEVAPHIADHRCSLGHQR